MGSSFASGLVRATGALLITLSALLPLSGCDDHHGGESFDTLPACVDDHASLGEPQSIAHCLVDFFDMDFADQAACVAYVTANGGYAASREQACTLYFMQRG